MPLFYKEFTNDHAGTFLYYPGTENRTPFKRRSITLIMNDATKDRVWKIIRDLHLERLSMENEIILSFPVSPQGGWSRAPFEVCKHVFDVCQSGMNKSDDLPLLCNNFGIPTKDAMMSTWHPMNDTKYLIGIEDGADFALTMAMCTPANIAAILVDGGVPKNGLPRVDSAMPICLINARDDVINYFRGVNGEGCESVYDGFKVSFPDYNPYQLTATPIKEVHFDAKLIDWVWNNIFVRVRRTNTCENGDIEPSMDIKNIGFEYHIHENILGDGKNHTWFIHSPQRDAPTNGWPLVMFFHGGSDNPAEAAEMSKLHELGEREGFITVYPWGTDCCGWNSSMDPHAENDVDFCERLMNYAIANYPVDPERVYLSGFSNGAAMAQTVALLNPEKVAALFHIDSNWPGKYGGYMAVSEMDITPFRLGFERKKEYDFRMPVWYTYGSREISFPVFRESTQQNQYDLWKRYNNVPVQSTPAQGEDSPIDCGVKGDVEEVIYPSKRHSKHKYKIERFFSDDPEPLNLYNFVVMYDKGHEVAQMDAELGFNYAKQFRRKADGSLLINK